jgi:hypothetical protein
VGSMAYVASLDGVLSSLWRFLPNSSAADWYLP